MQPAPVAAAPTPAPVTTPVQAKPSAAAVNPNAGIVGETAAVSTPSNGLEPTLYERSTNPDAGIVGEVAQRPGELESGTLIRVRTQEVLNTASTAVGTEFSAVVMSPVSQGGKVIIPMVGIVKGRVVSVKAGKSFGQKAVLRLRARTPSPCRTAIATCSMLKSFKLRALTPGLAEKVHHHRLTLETECNRIWCWRG